LVDNGFALLSIDPIYEQIAEGAIILGAVSIDFWVRRSSARSG
jgi:ribose/xylose/arabinose/galactoside ABC-type transport system permease subunit